MFGSLSNSEQEQLRWRSCGGQSPRGWEWRVPGQSSLFAMIPTGGGEGVCLELGSFER